MAYVGNPIDTQNTFQSLVGKRFNGDGSTTAFTLDVAPSSTLDIEVFVGNVRQDPNSAYTLSGTTLTFTGAPPSGTNNIYVVHQAKSVGTIDVPSSFLSTEQTFTGGLDINGTELKLDADADTSITADTDDQIDFKTGGTDRLKIQSTSGNNVVVADGLTLTDGNLIVASGHGVSFAATGDGAGTDTSELLDDYEEGTWTPALANFGGSNESFIDPRYTKIGRLVTVSCQLQIGSFSSDSSNFLLTGLPYTCKNANGTTFGTVPFRQTNTSTMGLTIGDNNTQMEMFAIPSGGQFNYNDFGQSKTMAFVAQYETD